MIPLVDLGIPAGGPVGMGVFGGGEEDGGFVEAFRRWRGSG